MKLKISYFFLACATAITQLNGSSKMQSKANQIHAQIQNLLEDLEPIQPQQSTKNSFDINNIELQENKTLSVEDMQKFIQTLQLTTQHLQQLNQQYQHQETVISQNKKIVQQLIKIADWLHQDKTIDAWNQYANIHIQTCTTIQKDLLALEPYAEFNDICLKIGQSIINTFSILILQFHHEKQNAQLKFFAQAYRDFTNLFGKYGIKTVADINSIVTSINTAKDQV